MVQWQVKKDFIACIELFPSEFQYKVSWSGWSGDQICERALNASSKANEWE